jgi:hypothetical protein
MMTIRSGYTQTIQGLTIDKDVEAELIYTFDWVDWLPAGDSLASVQYTASVRANDPDPLVIESQGINGTTTFVELHEGQLGKTYTVTCKITTANDLIDRRSFRVKVLARSA